MASKFAIDTWKKQSGKDTPLEQEMDLFSKFSL
jgi:hypothetical protein